jgi:hypothetical protein
MLVRSRLLQPTFLLVSFMLVDDAIREFSVEYSFLGLIGICPEACRKLRSVGRIGGHSIISNVELPSRLVETIVVYRYVAT